MSSVGPIIVDRGADGLAQVTINRPELHNAFDEEVIAALTESFSSLAEDCSVRAVLLSGAGKSFSAGVDLNWMKRASQQDEAANIADGRRLAEMLYVIDQCPKPVVGLINGAAYGGGVGLIACCDVALCVSSARFGLTEVRLGIIPAAISPFVIAKIGVSASRRWMLTGATFGADEALRIGLVHHVGEDAEMMARSVAADFLRGGPLAVADMKRMIGEVAGRPVCPDLMDFTARRIAAHRASDEGREGIAAFLEKRSPGWIA